MLQRRATGHSSWRVHCHVHSGGQHQVIWPLARQMPLTTNVQYSESEHGVVGASCFWMFPSNWFVSATLQNVSAVLQMAYSVCTCALNLPDSHRCCSATAMAAATVICMAFTASFESQSIRPCDTAPR